MNSVNYSSSTRNFMKNVYLEFVQNKKALLLSVIGIWSLYIFVGFCMGLHGKGGGTGEIVTFSVIAMFISMVVASVSFSNMKTKEQRIFNLMIPASIESKYFTRWIVVVPLLFIVLLIGFYLGDFSRIGTYLMNNPDTSADSEYVKIINPFDFYTGHGDEDGLLIFCLAFGSYFFIQSLYLFGAILWPKLSFIKTFSVIYVIQTIAGIILMWMHNNSFFLYRIEDVKPLLWCFTAILGIFTLLCYFLSYRRYKTSQIIYKLF